MKELKAFHNGEPMGVLRESAGGQNYFEYDPAWLANDGATPLSLAMPLQEEPHEHKVVDPYLWGLLPESSDILDRWAHQFGVSSGNPFGLLAHTGGDLAGAVTFQKAGPADAAAASVPVSGEDIAGRLRVLEQDPAAWQDPGGAGRFSLGGRSGKFALHQDGEGRWWTPSERMPSTHIFKPFASPDGEGEVNELLTLGAARRLGLAAAPPDVMSFGERRALVIQRYDRVCAADGTVGRIHQENFCQSLSHDPGREHYQHPGPGTPDILKHLIRFSSEPEQDVRAFLQALAFTWAIWGIHTSARSFSLVLSGTEVRLAPLYGMRSDTFPTYSKTGPASDRARLSLAVGGERRPAAIRRIHWEQLAEANGLDAGQVSGWARTIVTSTAEAFEAAIADNAQALEGMLRPEALLQHVRKKTSLLGGDDVWPDGHH